MKLQTRTFSFVAGILGLVLSVVHSVRAQGPPQKVKISAAAIVQARKAVDKAAADRNIAMTDAAKREVAVEVVRQEAATPKSTAAPAVPPEAKVDQLFKQIDFAKPGGAMDVNRVKEVVATDKASQIRATLAQELMTHATTAGITLPDDVQALLVGDLQRQTAGLAASGLPVDVIKTKNENFFKAMAQGLQGAPITSTSYRQVQQQIFQRFVNLRIESVPTGATVKMNDVELGTTDIPEQPLEPGKTYEFEFALAGYDTAQRPYFVAAGDASAVLSEPLVATTPSARSDAKLEESPVVTTPAGRPFPFLYVIIGLVLLGGLVLVARRR
jgi:hypothetical protein